MSLDDRFRHSLTEALAGARARLESEFDMVLGDLRAAVARERDDVLSQAEMAKAAAVAEARDILQRELREAFDVEKLALVDAHAIEYARWRTETEQALAAAAQSSAEVEQSRTEIEQARAEAEQARGEAELARRETAQARAETEQARAEIEQALAETAHARAETAQVRTEIEQVRGEAERASADHRAEADATIEAIRSELRDAQSGVVRERDAYERAVAEMRGEISRLTEALAAASRERETLTAELAHAHEAQLSAGTLAEQTIASLRTESQAAITMTRAQAEAASAALRAEMRETASSLMRELETQQAAGARLLHSVGALDAAASLPEVLDALAHGAGKEAGRAAVIVVKGDRLIGWRSAGFANVDDDPRSILLGTGEPGALAAAVNTGRPAPVGHGVGTPPPAFSEMGPSGSGLAVPLLVAGKAVAVVYAEAGAGNANPGWSAPVELLARHASRCIEALAVQRPSHSRATGPRAGVPA